MSKAGPAWVVPRAAGNSLPPQSLTCSLLSCYHGLGLPVEFFYRFLRPLVELVLPGAGSSSYPSIISSVQKLAREFPGLPWEFLWVTQHTQHVQGHSPCPQLHYNYSYCVNSECTCMYPPDARRQECWEDQEVFAEVSWCLAFPDVSCSAD